MYQELIIQSNATIHTALVQMDNVGKKLLMVYENSKFKGLVSIGEIQRAIIRKKDLSEPVSNILISDVLIADDGEEIASIKNKMLKIRAEFMPVINRNGEVVKVVFWKDLFDTLSLPPQSQFDLPVVIMAGGLGTRLRPLTHVIPKPLIPIGDKTILEHIFETFNNHGSSEFYISVNYKAELIEYYIKSRTLPYRLDFFKEDKPMGTGGSLSLLKGKLNKTFFVSNCDILIEQDYSEILDYHRKNHNELTIVAAIKNYEIPYGTIDAGNNGELIRLIEKPDMTFFINSGMYILEPHLIDEVPTNEYYHITELINQVKKRGGKVGIFPVSEKSWKDVGNWENYSKLLY